MKVKDIMLKVVKTVFSHDPSLYKVEEKAVFYGNVKECVITVTPSYNSEKRIFLYVDNFDKNSVQFMYRKAFDNIRHGVRATGKTQIELAISITECLMHYYYGDWMI